MFFSFSVFQCNDSDIKFVLKLMKAKVQNKKVIINYKNLKNKIEKFKFDVIPDNNIDLKMCLTAKN